MSNQSSYNVAVIIPIHLQTENIDRILIGIDSQTIRPNHVIFVFDRTPLIDMQVKYYNVHMVELSVPVSPRRGSGFFAGAARNAGIEYAKELGVDVYIFIDGDCIPQPKLVEGYLNVCTKGIPVLSCGRRREKRFRWSDQREMNPDLVNIGFFRKEVIISDPELLKSCLVVWSCNLAMNSDAIDRLCRFNNKYYGRSEVFSSEFDGGWGGEDSFLGIEAWMSRIFIVANNLASVEHIDHTRSLESAGIEHKEFFGSIVSEIRKKTFLSPLELDFFKTSRN